MNKNSFIIKQTVAVVCAFLALNVMNAQNITDLSVMNGTSEQNDGMLNIASSPAIPDSVFRHPGRIRYDNRCFQIEGKDTYLFSGTFHYFRVPQALWADRLKKLKAAGFNCVETYIPWNWHEREMPISLEDDSKIRLQELEDFLKMAESYGFYTILRPGPYICAEWSGGGFPQWLMRKKPANTAFSTWLQSNDPEFMKWNEHWYKAVCRVVAPHQLNRKPVGGKGVILFQVENEYNRVKWFPKEMKRDYLEKLAGLARKYGIEVPIITCWTDESRNVSSGFLNGTIDMVNSYPRWNIERAFGGQVDLYMKTQAGKPLISGELQGGWCCELGWPLSWKQDGLPPVQTQNITLYALQRGFSALNFYMAVGGTNFDDWAARQQITSYDYAAAIGEGGTINERYRRFRGLSAFIREHGTRIARADLVPVNYTTTDPDVKVAVRIAGNGDRYIFIRTEEHYRQHFGTVTIGESAIDFALEPFGSEVLYLPAGAKKGKWYPELPVPALRKVETSATIALNKVSEWSDELPDKWTKLKAGETVDAHGVYGRHFVYYKTSVFEGTTLEIGRIGKGLVNNTAADTALVMVKGRLVPIISETKERAYYQIPGDSTTGKKTEAILLYESKGLHHHTNGIVEQYWNIGPSFVRNKGKNISLSYAYTEDERGKLWSSGNKLPDSSKKRNKNVLLKWYQYEAVLSNGAVDMPYFLTLEQQGNGFVYVNGYCIGRCWEQGPQRDYYVPECWLNKSGKNFITISLRPTNSGVGIKKAELKAVND